MLRPNGSLLLIVAAALLSGSVAACDNDKEITADSVPVRVLTWNIGNPNADDPGYYLRLKSQAYEDYVASRIAALSPDIVFLQEVLAETRCATMMETDPALTCYDAEDRDPPIRRLLGPDYTIACDGRLHVECVGVHVSFGGIEGLEVGGYDIGFAETPPLPLPACDWAAGTCTNDLCDFESTVSAVTANTRWGDLRLVHLHPNAAGSGDAGIYTGAPCRALQLQQVFEGFTDPYPDPDNGNVAGADPLIADGPTLLAGDFNMDPVRMATRDEKDIWASHIGDGSRFADFTPTDADGVQYGTRRGSAGMAIDHVLSEAARSSGSCTVFGWDEGFGSDPGTLPLDEDFDWSQVPDGKEYASRIDHFAILCDLTLDLR